jgi:transcriptional regulator with XRE-family HTH domain
MELAIGKVICDLRKKSGITQEQIADAVGVSVPAVSKWETGNSYPDITLLIPIARYLGVTVDKLLHYECEISNEKVLEIVKKCTQRFEAEGFDAGLELCNDYLKNYPNNLYLKFRISGLLPWFAAKKCTSEETVQNARKQAVSLLKEACESKEEKISNASSYMLACTYIQMNKSKEAQNILETMPKSGLDPNKILPTVYMQQGEIAKAVKLYQQNLLNDLNGVTMALTGLAGIAMKEKKWKDALEYADAQRKLIETFKLEDFMLASNYHLYLSIYSKRKDAENTLLYLKKYFSVFPYDMSKLQLSDNFFFSMVGIQELSIALNFTKDTVIRAIKENPGMDFLRDDTRFQSLLENFQCENMQ